MSQYDGPGQPPAVLAARVELHGSEHFKLEQGIVRMLAEVEGYDQRLPFIVFGARPDAKTAVVPLVVPTLGNRARKEGNIVRFIFCLAPNVAIVCNRDINPGFVFGAQSLVRATALPGMSLRVIEGTMHTAFGLFWSSVFTSPCPELTDCRIVDWEIELDKKKRISEVRVGVEVEG